MQLISIQNTREESYTVKKQNKKMVHMPKLKGFSQTDKTGFDF